MSIFKSIFKNLRFESLRGKLRIMDKLADQLQPDDCKSTHIKMSSELDDGKNETVVNSVTTPKEEPADVTGKKRELETDDVNHKKLKPEQFVKRKKVALLLSYCGYGYMGMQRNPGVKTIEDDLLMALLKADLITREHFDSPQTMNFQRAARTDKGVSAARQVVSLKLALGDNLEDRINEYLPPCIRVQNIKRSTRGFNSKFWCDARTYSYTLPTFAFAPSCTDITSEDYRIDETVIERVNDVLNSFKGTHNFHNFTSGKKFEDASAKRYIMDFKCGKPFVDDGLEVVVVSVKGQSFMLHQIRKMIGITVAIMRDLATMQVIEKAWEANKVDIPVAPGLGLVLEEVHYDKYNLRYENDGIHEAMKWDDIKDKIEEFKKKFIYLPIIRVERESKSTLNWLATLPNHTYDIREPSAPETGNRSEFGKAKKLVESLTETEFAEINDKT